MRLFPNTMLAYILRLPFGNVNTDQNLTIGSSTSIKIIAHDGSQVTPQQAPPIHVFLVIAFRPVCPITNATPLQDLLALVESRSNAARKLSIAVLGIILDHIGECRGILDPALTAVLRLARSDGDATVRCAAFDCVTERLGEINHCRTYRE